MQPCSREMQGLNSLLNSSSQISLQDLQNHTTNQIQNSHMNHQHQLAHFDSTSHDDFLEQMLSSCSWTDLNPNKPLLWDPNTLNDIKPPDETTPSNNNDDATANVVFPSFDEHSTLASKFRNHQISPNNAPKNAAAAAFMLQHQLLRDSGLLNMPLSLPGNDVVDASSFKSPNPVPHSYTITVNFSFSFVFFIILYQNFLF